MRKPTTPRPKAPGRKPKLTTKTDDPGQYLPLLARGAADKVRAPKEAFTRAAALAAAPWDESMPAPWEDPFRRAYADRLEERGFAKPAGKSGTRNAGGETELERLVVYVSSEEKAQHEVTAKAAGLKLSAWARRKLAT